MSAAIALSNLGPCWHWPGSTNSRGYGKIATKGRRLSIHRVVWEAANGPIPAGLSVLHRCDVPACFNPAHLFLGTASDNMRDMVAKGRGRGQLHGLAKLSAAEVRQVRRRYYDPTGGETIASLARAFGVSWGCISSAVADRPRHGD